MYSDPPRALHVWICVVCISLIATAVGAPRDLSRKQIEAEAKTRFQLWLANTFTQCGDSYFAKHRHYDFVYQVVGPTIAFGAIDQSFDKLNNITIVTISVQFSAQKSRMSARPDTLLWQPGLHALLTSGGTDVDVTVKGTNNQWTVEPGSWYYDVPIDQIPCDEIPETMGGPAEDKSATQAPQASSTDTAQAGEPTATAESSAASENAWYLLGPLSCERQDPRSVLASAKLLGTSVVAHDEKDGGKIVATTISAADGSSARFYRGKKRCEAALKRGLQDLDRYN